MKERFGALTVLMNGPRHFMMDELSASGGSKLQAKTSTRRHGVHRARLDRPDCSTCVPALPPDAPSSATRLVLQGREPVFLLERLRRRYFMQAYAQIVDKTLTYDDLAGLGREAESAGRLALPSARCRSRTFLVLGA